jgi:competence protein ComEC
MKARGLFFGFAFRAIRAAAAACILFALALGSVPGQEARGASGPSLRVAFINILQGDAALLQDGSGHTMLIDGGLRVMGPTLVDYLNRRGVTTIDVMVVSHADSDHVGGLVTVLQSQAITTAKIVYNGRPGSNSDWTDFLAAASARGITPEIKNFPSSFDVGEMHVEVLNPAVGQTSADIDDTSLVLRVDHGQVHFLFSGDIGTAGESAVLGRAVSPVAQILKVAHHGNSAGASSAFLARVQPDDSVISTSLAFPPHNDTLERLRNAGSAIWRTDLLGTIEVHSNGMSYRISEETDEYPYQTHLPVVIR